MPQCWLEGESNLMHHDLEVGTKSIIYLGYATTMAWCALKREYKIKDGFAIILSHIFKTQFVSLG